MKRMTNLRPASRRFVRGTSMWSGVLALLISFSAQATPTCAQVLKAIGNQLADVTCFESTDLTTNNPLTTPANNSIPGLPAFAFTPITDRGVISPSLPHQTPITKVVPGLQIQARIASDPTGQGRFLLRLPNDWNGRLVVAGASGTRSEFNGDFAWSDYVVQKGYAYASQNKGVLNLQLSAATDPLGCRLNPASSTYVRFYDNAPDQPFTRWREYMIRAARLARDGVHAGYGNWPRFTYAVGTSNGGYQVRRAIETEPELFDGGVDWEGTFVDEHAPNILTDLPPAILNFPDYVASGFKADSTAAKNIGAAGYPPDIVLASGASLWNNYSTSFWEVTQCQWQKRLDPTYDTYGSGTGTYNYVGRLPFTDVGEQMAAFATSGKIQRPLITVAGTMDALLPIDHHARAYARKVTASKQKGDDDDRDHDRHHGWDHRRPAYRLYEVQNGNHIETYQDTFPQLELIQPHAQRAFDLLVQHVERGISLPPSQCIPRGGSIADSPSQPRHCTNFFVP
ncbi:MAG TPA: 3-hydroxybutyrate oligomer hydrolase family protein [Burkholderiales bacterium]|nr:3-hydroxybutyrate oligomer hydrolase family protein [Burkholderiales bacterium]